MATDFNPTILPNTAVHPGEFLQDDLDALGMTAAELARQTGRPLQEIEDIIAGQAMISEQAAIEFERVLGTPASSWLNLCTLYDRILANGGKPASQLPTAERAR